MIYSNRTIMSSAMVDSHAVWPGKPILTNVSIKVYMIYMYRHTSLL